jgi:hypothetical protein
MSQEIEWIWKIMEIRKKPELASHDDIVKMTDEILYKQFSSVSVGEFNLSQNLTKISVENISEQ